VTATDLSAAATAAESHEETIRRIKDATVFIKVRTEKEQGSGSGFVFQVNGDTVLVATNHHVIAPHLEGAEEEADPKDAAIKADVTVVFRSGRGSAEQSVPAEIIATDREGNRDLAILRVTGVTNPPRPIVLSQESHPTETMPVLIYGFPFGNIDKMLNNAVQGGPAITINKGSVSSLRLNEFNKVSYIQIDGSLNPGNSGGPVVDEQGRLVGVAVAQISNTTIGFAVPTGELRRMLDGRLGRLSMAFRAEKEGKADLQVQVKVIDPLKQVRGVSFYFVPAANTQQPLPKPNSDGTWPPLPGATSIRLGVNDQVATAPFQAPVNESAGRRLLVQASYLDNQGRTIYTNPVSYQIPVKPTGMLAIGGAAAQEGPKLAPTFKALGPLADANKNCKMSRDEKSLTIDVPAGVHLLSPELDLKNSPMTLAAINGDFVAQVKIAGDMQPGSQTTRHRGKGLPFTFQGAGLLLWLDKNNYMRFERTVGTAGDNLVMVHRLLLEVCRNGKPAGHLYLDIKEGPIYVRIARVNGGIQCMLGPDGKRWAAFKRLAVSFPSKAQIGLSASNASKEPLAARFEEFVLITDPKQVKQMMLH
jgi:S1-C subfamily serine protease/regulation of enolase protein 1 (concanavalin A-like superfamily)